MMVDPAGLEWFLYGYYVSPKEFGDIAKMIQDGMISEKGAAKVFRILWEQRRLAIAEHLAALKGEKDQVDSE